MRFMHKENSADKLMNAGYKPNETQVLNIITRICDSRHGWFISGSYANRKITSPNDIDVYFENDRIMLEVIERLKTESKHCNVYLTGESALSITVMPKGWDILIQFIKLTGTVTEVLDRFDLNVCKKVLLPNGEYYEHPRSNLPLNIDTINYHTFSRFFKYLYRLNPDIHQEEVLTLSKKLIDTFIDSNDLITGYYGGEHCKSTINEQLYNYFKEDTEIKPYLIESALKHSPGLLI